MKTTFRLLCILSLALLLTGAGKAVPELPNVQNLKHDAEQMQRERQVMVLFFTAEHCMYCQAPSAPKSSAGPCGAQR
jgi:thioredoxin-related protein